MSTLSDRIAATAKKDAEAAKAKAEAEAKKETTPKSE